MGISGIEVVAGLAWLVGVGGAVWGWRVHRVTGSETTMLLVFLTLIPLLGPVAVLLFVALQRNRSSRHNPMTP